MPPTTPRRGRPPAQEAGQAAERILDAATSLFLEQGFGRTTLDQVAARAKTGKSSLYGHFKDKETLFSAVVHHSIELMFAEMDTPPKGASLDEQLRITGKNLAEKMLLPRCAALMRITAAEAETMPDLARSAYQVSFDGTVQRLIEVLEGELSPADHDLAAIARRFVELALQPLSFQAAFGGDLAKLLDRSADDIEDAILLLRSKNLLG